MKPPTLTRPAPVLTKENLKYLKLHSTLKLQQELVPNSCWFSNVRSEVRDKDWDIIRRSVYARENFLCEICGGKGTKHPVECHEVWNYDDVTFIQRLEGFRALCPLCHEVKHMGLAGIRGNGPRAMERFESMNELDRATSRKITTAILEQWFIRCKHEWTLDISYLKEYGIDWDVLKNKKQLKNKIK